VAKQTSHCTKVETACLNGIPKLLFTVRIIYLEADESSFAQRKTIPYPFFYQMDRSACSINMGRRAGGLLLLVEIAALSTFRQSSTDSNIQRIDNDKE
jgi:hypothetical protein